MTEYYSRSEKLLAKMGGEDVDIDFEPTCDFEEICMCLIIGGNTKYNDRNIPYQIYGIKNK